MKKSDVFKLAFGIAVSVLPGAVGDSIRHVVETVKADAPADEKKSVAVAKVLGSESVATLNALIKDGAPLHDNPKAVAIVGKINDALYQGAKELAELIAATDGVAGVQQ